MGVIAAGVLGLVALALGAGCDGALVPGPVDQAEARDRRDSAALSAQLRALPGVQSASVVVRRPIRDPLAPATATPPPASAAVLVIGPDSARAPAQALASAALPELPAAAIAVVVVPAPGTAAEVAKVGPFWVARRSRVAVMTTLVAALGVIAGLALVLAGRERRRAAAAPGGT